MKFNNLIICGLMLFISCNFKINRYKIEGKKQFRNGKWIEKDSADNGLYVMKGRYKKGEKIGVWRTRFNESLYQKDRIKDSITTTRKYFPNGKIIETGKTKLITGKDNKHWFYFGEWNYFDEKGKLKYKKIYKLNQKADSISYQKTSE